MLVRKKRTIITLFLSLLIADLCLTYISSAELSKPQTTVGDYWNYGGNYFGTTATFKETVTERTNITIENEIYDVFVSVSTADGTGPNNASLNRKQIAFYRVSDGAIIKIIDYFNYSSDAANQTYANEYIYSPPLDMMHYPISVGETWENRYVLKITDLHTKNTSEQSINESSECERVTIDQEMGRDFDCYVVKNTQFTEEGRWDSWYYLSSEMGGNPVRLDIDFESQPIVSLRLTSYSVAHPGESKDKGTPGFELALSVVAVAFTIAILLKRKRA